ncbi:MAG: type II secretion system F family protein [Thaumarchaeota archaeon]|nr:type II secretion system F family protein [Nitrososphaerota archaeon]
MRLRDLHNRRKELYLASLAAAVMADAGIAALNLLEGVKLPFQLGTTLLLVGLLSFVFPGLVDTSYHRWREKIDDALPTLLADITSNVRIGFSLTRSFELAVQTNYGPLSKELQRMKAQLSWGVPFEEVVRLELKRLDSQTARRTLGVLLKVDQGGGNVEDVLKLIQDHTSELHQIAKERKGVLRPYVVTTYMAVFIFLAIAVVLINSFFGQMLSAQQQVGSSIGSVFPGLGGIDIQSIKGAFLQMSLVEAIAGGLGAGKLGQGSFVAGFPHVLILVATTIAVFLVLVG